MKLRDFMRYLMEMSLSKLSRLKRILWIMSLGSVLVFGISISTTLLESWISQTYKDRHVLLPYNLDATYLDEIPIELISPYHLKQISNSFENTKITSSDRILNLDIEHLSSSKKGTLSYTVHNKGYISVQVSLMEYYNWNETDWLRIGTMIYPIYHIHYSEDVDLKLPFYFINSQSTKLNYDNILTVYSNHDIQEIVDAINQQLSDPNYYYEVEPFSMDDLLLSLLQLLRRILMTISLCIFLVSASNIGTLMPYFIMEYQDEIDVLRLHGLPKETLISLFVSFTVLILLTSMFLSSISTVFIFKLLSFLFNIPFSIPLFKLLILTILQVSFATLLTLGSIKKAMDSIAYI